ncbi:MAG: inositol monophosphatase family protein [Planctomycetota bacterium]|jgi:myo-inositol-1(or 4)-monophosphatase|nr:inositol monophosphatase family protein [Planctomycetota bacterium]MDP6941774.1 inositol monophosphatase family protein [Planctomycetota bacterium]
MISDSDQIADLAQQAGKILLEKLRSLQELEIQTKSSPRDLVSVADRESEEFLVEGIQKLFPGDGILAEEGGLRPGETDNAWCIDPLDGTVNFLQGLPMFAVSIARLKNGTPDLAVVHLPVLRETFSATLGGGTYLNGKQVTVSSKGNTLEAVLATGFPYRRHLLRDNNLENFNRMFLNVRGLRRMGSAAIDLAYVSAGKLDAFWELHLSPWDVAAGGLLVSEAGGVVDTISPGGDWLNGRNIIAGPAPLLKQVRDTLLMNRGGDYPDLGDLPSKDVEPSA